MRRPGLATITAFALLLAGADAARAEVLASVPAPTTVAAGHGVIAWSTLDPADGRYWLTASVGGVVGRLPISPRSVPFDVDVGDLDGRTVLTYSRCAHDPVRLVRPPLPDWTGGLGCRPWWYDPATGIERRFTGMHVPTGSSIVLPSAAGGILAFAMTSPGQVAHIYRTVVARPRRLSEARLGTRTPYAAPTDVEVSGSRVAVIWDGLTSPGCKTLNPTLQATGSISEVHLPSIGEDRRLARTCESSPTLAFTSVAWTDTSVAFEAISATAQSSVLERRSRSGALLGRQPLPTGATWLDLDDGTVVAVVVDAATNGYDIVLS
ncbi:MAG: hypothetical protein QOJ34_1497 [Pseudonocardiales bacterium]|nr:hypothetical protein [Pseudonocardiales bacterium]